MRREESGQAEPHPGETPDTTHPEAWVGGWISPILVTGFTLLWVLLIYLLIGDRPRDWQYGVVPYVPGESIISSQRPPAGVVPRQVELPPVTPGGRNAPR